MIPVSTNFGNTYKSWRSFDTFVVARYELHPLVVEHDVGSHFIGGQHNLIRVILKSRQSKTNIESVPTKISIQKSYLDFKIIGSIGEAHVPPCHNDGELGHKVTRADHAIPEVGQQSVAYGHVPFLLHFHNAQVDACIGNALRDFLVNKERGNHGRIHTLGVLLRWHGEGDGKLVGQQSLIEGQVTITLDLVGFCKGENHIENTIILRSLPKDNCNGNQRRECRIARADRDRTWST